MKRTWLRGMLLGVSLALLLAGGVALAQVTLTVDQDCFECWPASGEPDPEHNVVLTLGGYSQSDLCGELEINGEIYLTGDCSTPRHAPPCVVFVGVFCQDLQLAIAPWDCVAPQVPAGLLDAGAANGPVEYGDWVMRAWQEENGQRVEPVREAAFTFAEDCEALEVEFVPEPGTIALLGSGLAGLAGYATLRWRAHS